MRARGLPRARRGRTGAARRRARAGRQGGTARARRPTRGRPAPRPRRRRTRSPRSRTRRPGRPGSGASRSRGRRTSPRRARQRRARVRPRTPSEPNRLVLPHGNRAGVRDRRRRDREPVRGASGARLDVSVLTRRAEHAAALAADGLRISGKSELAARVQATADPDELPDFDLGILATKATQLENAAAALAGRFPGATLMTIQNGLGAEELVRTHGDWPLLSAVTFMSGVRHWTRTSSTSSTPRPGSGRSPAPRPTSRRRRSRRCSSPPACTPGPSPTSARRSGRS